MLGAGEFIFELRHLLFCAVEHATEFIRKSKIDMRAGDSRPPFELGGQSFTQTVRGHANLLEQRLSDPVALIEKSRQKMFVGNFLMIELRSDILRRLQRLLHLLGELVDAHAFNIVIAAAAAIARNIDCSVGRPRLSVLPMSAKETWMGRKALALLRAGPFRRYIIGSAISDTGTWMQVMAQGWVMATLTTSALMLGLVQLCAGLPMLALTMVGGAAADKFDKRKILIWTQFAQTALALILGMLVYTGRIQ